MAAKKGRVKHIPQRTCIICGETNAKRTLTRLVRTAEDGVQVDSTGKRAGRGAYLCSNIECWQKALRTEALAKALRSEITAVDRERLAAHTPSLEQAGEGKQMKE